MNISSGFKFCFIPFVPRAPFLYSLKTSENRKILGGRERMHLKQMGLSCSPKIAANQAQSLLFIFDTPAKLGSQNGWFIFWSRKDIFVDL